MMNKINKNLPFSTLKTAVAIAVLPLLLGSLAAKQAQASPMQTLLKLTTPDVNSGETVTIDALLTIRGSGGQPIPGKEVNLEVSGHTLQATTDGSGDARFTYNAPVVSGFFSQHIVASFHGDRKYEASQRNGNVHVIAAAPPVPAAPPAGSTPFRPSPSTGFPSAGPVTPPVMTQPVPTPPATVKPVPAPPDMVMPPHPAPPVVVKPPHPPAVPIQSVLSAFDRAGVLGSQVSLQAQLTDGAGKPIVGATIMFSVLSSALNFQTVGVTDDRGVATSVEPIRIVNSPTDQFQISTWPIHVYFKGRYPYPAVSAVSTLTLTPIFQKAQSFRNQHRRWDK